MTPGESEHLKALHTIGSLKKPDLERVIEILDCEPQSLRPLYIDRNRIADMVIHLEDHPKYRKERK